jgi:hypothetical protein
MVEDSGVNAMCPADMTIPAMLVCGEVPAGCGHVAGDDLAFLFDCDNQPLKAGSPDADKYVVSGIDVFRGVDVVSLCHFQFPLKLVACQSYTDNIRDG